LHKDLIFLTETIKNFGKIKKKTCCIIHLLKILAFVATITAKNNYHGTNQKRKNRFLTNQKAAAIILAQ
jgi:hypothetical protein